MIRHIKKRPIIAAIVAMAFAATPATFLAQTEEAATAVPTPVVATEIEMERRFNEFRSQYLDDRADSLDDRADSINWWLGSIAIVLTFFGVVVAVAGFIGFRRFQAIEAEARKHVDEIKSHKAQAQKAVDDIRGITAQDAADPVKAKQAEKDAETVLQDPNAPLIDKAIADAYSLQKAGKTEKAMEKWRSIARSMEGVDNEIAARAWFSVGYLLSLSKNPTGAISAYDQVIRLDPSNSAAYNNRGSAKIDLEQPKEAIKDCDEAILLDPSNAAAYSNRGSAKGFLGQHKEAIEDFDRAIHLDPSNAVAYNNRGNAKNNLGEHREAIKDCDEAIRLDPSNAGAYSNRGNAKIRLEQYEESIKDCDEAIRLDSSNSFAYYNWGCAKAGLKRIEEARSDFQTALRLAQEQGNKNLATAITDALHQIDNPKTK